VTKRQVEKPVAKAKPKNSAAAGLESKRHKTGPLQPTAFRPPTPLSQEHVSEICAGFGISDRHAAKLKNLFDELVSMLHGWMSQEKTFQEKPANRQRDRTGIVKIRKQIADAQDELKELGIDGKKVVRSIAAPLADIVSGDWLRYHFPDDAPSRTGWLRRVPRSVRDPDREQRDWERNSNYQFMRDQATETLLALLQDLHSALASALTLTRIRQMTH
jgi:hypothetical protein